MQDAPFFAEMAHGPKDGQAFWLTTSDGIKIRVGLWRPAPDAAAAGTVLLFPGRTEYVEKYGRTASDLAKAGLATLVIDWRGQGLSDRLIDNPMSGHVHHFTDYQKDVAAMVQAATALDLPKPWFLLGHSMGGCIGLRSVMEGLPVAAATFSAPMWGIRISVPLRPVAWSLSWGSRGVGLSHLYAPGTTGGDSYVLSEPFETNKLTTDPKMFDYMVGHLKEKPELGLGGPSLRWLYEALNETRQLWRRPSPDLPCLTLLGSEEEIVDVPRIHDRMARWPGGVLEVVEGARHEVLMEDAKTRGWLTDRMIHFFADAAKTPSQPDADAPDAGSAAPSHPPAQGIA